jgi:GNAT superfamily N-acetyltransferase
MEDAAMPDPILMNITEEELGRAVEENVFAMFRDMTRVLNGEMEETAQLGRYHASPISPIFKGAYRANLTADSADDAIVETIAWFKERNAPFFFWWTGQDSQPGDLGERLIAHGFSVFERDAPAMAAEIDTLNWDNPRPAELSLRPIENDDQLVQWKQTFIEAFGIPEFAGQAWVDATRAVGIGRTPWHLLLGTLNAEPVCCGLLYCGAGVAGLLGLGTLPAYRKKGIGSAMQLERLRIARDLGYRYAVLFASEMGYSPYLKLGFRDTGRRVSRYLWRNA